YIDLDDPDCSNPSDDTEDSFTPGRTECSDGIDNDNDNYIDLDDPDCSNPSDDTEDSFTPGRTECSDGIDNDNDNYIDLDDPGCDNLMDDDETNPYKLDLFSNLLKESYYEDEKIELCFNNYANGSSQIIKANMTLTFLNKKISLNSRFDSHGNRECIQTGEKLNEGTYEVRINVDDNDAYTEKDENNNRKLFLIEVIEKEDDKDLSIAIRNFDFFMIDHQKAENLDDLRINLVNDGDEDIENLRLTISIPELSTWDKIGPLDLDVNERINKHFRLNPYDYEPGWYYVRVSMSSEDYTRAKWYEVYIK
ncbi:MAG: hypothetical protein ACQER9_04865, partial [Nanobdellota archaeon]